MDFFPEGLVDHVTGNNKQIVFKAVNIFQLYLLPPYLQEDILSQFFSAVLRFEIVETLGVYRITIRANQLGKCSGITVRDPGKQFFFVVWCAALFDGKRFWNDN